MAEEAEPEAVRPIDSKTWHLADFVRPVTLCGETIYYGAPRRRMWHETPEEDRCQLCFRGFSSEPTGRG
jgi:hypothetical protein